MRFLNPSTHLSASNTSATGSQKEQNQENDDASQKLEASPDAIKPISSGDGTPMARSFSPNFTIQPKLEIGEVDDPYEREADAVADRVVQGKGIPDENTSGNIPPSANVPTIQRTPGDPVEVELVPTSPEDSEHLRSQGIQLPTVSGSTWTAIGGAPYTTLLPGYSQQGDTCGAASLVSALLIWDREHWDPALPNERLVNACNLILIAYERHASEAVRRWAAHPAPMIRQGCAGQGSDCISDAYVLVKNRLMTSLQGIRDAARQRGARVSEADYQNVAFALYFIWHEGAQAGLSSSDIQQIQQTLGLSISSSTRGGNIQSFDDIFTNPIIVGLQPDRFAQVTWMVTAGQHAFLLGRLQSGEWFWSDQGPQPAVEFRAPTLAGLRDAVRTAAITAGYWIFLGSHSDLMSRGGLIPGWTGVIPLGEHRSVTSAAHNLVPPGAFLGEVDEGYLTDGSQLNSIAFVAEKYSLADAQAQFPATARNSALIIEMPRGVFQLYSASAVSSDNLSQVALDTADSGSGVLSRRTFHHTWLKLGTSAGRQGSWFSVY